MWPSHMYGLMTSVVDTETGLPRYQISALQGYAAKLADTLLIWIYALSIPQL